MEVTAIQLSIRAVTIQPATEAQKCDITNQALAGELAMGVANRQGLQLCCLQAFEATWNGGPGTDDIEIRLEDADPDQPAFVQSQLGEGLLSFYPGYQFKTADDYLLWVRGPTNAPRDGIAALESLVDCSILPGAVVVQWQFTRPHHTIRFKAGEAFATLLPYAKTSLEEVSVDLVEVDANVDSYAQTFQQMVEAPALQSLFERLGAVVPDTAKSKWASRLVNPPPVSCICPTYGRVELLEEAIHSFLQQDYPGEKELIVLNDYDCQTLEFDHPEVRIVNLSKRLHSVGEKYKAAAALASHDLIFVWHDDDIYLPHRLSYSVAHCNEGTSFFKADKAWYWNNGELSGPEQNHFHGGSCWRRGLYNKVHGYSHIGNGYDVEFEQRCWAAAAGEMRVEPIQPADIYYIYRWNGTNSYHFSGIGADGQEHQKVAAYVEKKAASGQIPEGRVQLQPRWKSDYGALVQTRLSTLPKAKDSSHARTPKLASCFYTIDGHVDLQQYEPDFFFSDRFFSKPRDEYLRMFGEVSQREYFIIDALKLVYLSIPKVACTAIKLALAKVVGIDFEPDQNIDYLVHSHPKWHREGGSLKETLNDFYRFAFVRNPFDRLVSCYRGKIIFTPTPQMRSPLYHGYYFSLPTNISFADFAQRVSRIPDALADSHFKSQYAMLYSNDVLQVDYVGRFEQFDRDWQRIAARYQLDPLLGQANVSKNKPGCFSDYRLYYTEPLVQLVYERYRRDVERLGYQEEYKQLLDFVRERERHAAAGPNEEAVNNGQESVRQ